MNDAAPGTPVLTLEECHHCGALVPVGAFCGNCGAHLADTAGRVRLQQYAASPGEPMVHASIITTLFPHLPHRHAAIFRIALGVGLLAVVLLAALRLYTSALIGATALLPVLYLLYLYEVDVYESEPVPVLAATFVTGAVLGVVYTLISGALITGTLDGTSEGPLVSAVLLPVIAQVLMIVGPLFLLSRSRFDEALDGLTFGVASALGFTLAAVLTGYWHAFTAPLQGSAAVSADDILRLARVGILVTLFNAATTGMITASVWLRLHSLSRHRHAAAWRGVQAAVAAAFAAQVALGLLTYYLTSLLLLVVIWVLAVVLSLVAVRVIVHHALLEEGAEHAVGDLSACPECHRLVPTMLFCPACGVARSASPKHARPAPPATLEAHG